METKDLTVIESASKGFLKKTALEVHVHNVNQLGPEEYAMSRRDTFGASDMSILLKLNTFGGNSPDKLVEQKASTILTEEELAIGKKEVVRKGNDLEELILLKFSKLMGLPIPYKPPHTYRFVDMPWMSINFDGIVIEDGMYIPVECKYVSPYGNKYYDRTRANYREIEVDKVKDRGLRTFSADMQKGVDDKAHYFGIPNYYYPQVVDQIAGLKAPYGYFAALFDKGWELCVWKIPADVDVFNWMIRVSNEAWASVERMKKNG